MAVGFLAVDGRLSKGLEKCAGLQHNVSYGGRNWLFENVRLSAWR